MHISLHPESSRPSPPQLKPDDDNLAPTDAPPAYTPYSSDPTPSSSHPAHPVYVPPPDPSAPPQWEASVGDTRIAQLYPFGIYHDAGRDNFERGMRFCEMHPYVDAAQNITPQQRDTIFTQGVGAWTLSPPSQFNGKVSRSRDGATEVKTHFSPNIDKTLVSSLPVLWGRYSPPEHSKGVYYEVKIKKLGKDAVVAIGFGCLPYPTDFRLPGWHRQSAAIHSDDGFKYFENPDGGVPFMNTFRVNDTIGVGIYHPTAKSSGSVFYTVNGELFPADAFSGAFFPRENFDVFAMIGISGKVEISVNFGAQEAFKWRPANEWVWKVGQETFGKTKS